MGGIRAYRSVRQPRPGKPRSLTSEDEDFIYDFTDREPRSVNKIIAALENLRGKKVSKSTVKRILKKKKVWKRIRKSLKGKRNEEKFREAQEEIKLLEQRRENGELELYYPHSAPPYPFPEYNFSYLRPNNLSRRR